MYKEKKVAVVVPCYNEESKIGPMLEEVPEYIEKIYVVDDCSTDGSAEVVRRRAREDCRFVLIEHEKNRGVGAAISTGYKTVLKSGEDIAVVMAGDGQMDPADLPELLNPLVDDSADYIKGNRFFHRVGVGAIPPVRLVGNMALSALTKIVSGYWHISDTQCGYTAINRKFLDYVDWDEVYPRYGCPNDILTRLNIVNARVAEVPVCARYGQSWASKMKVWKIAGPLLALLFSLFMTRIYRKHIYLDGHPLIYCYGCGIMSSILAVLTFAYLVVVACVSGNLSIAALIILSTFSILANQLLLNAFAMDYEENKHLYIRLPYKRVKLYGGAVDA